MGKLQGDCMINEGIYPDLSNESYHADRAISRSGIKLFCESPYKYWAHYLNPDRPPVKQTDAMTFGSAFHTYILEPKKWDDIYIVQAGLFPLPKCGLLRNIGREEFEKQKEEKARFIRMNDRIKEDFVTESEGKIIISCDEHDQLEAMKQALINHPQAWSLIKDGIYEESYFWRDEHSDLMIKCRPDIIQSNCIVDLKTCASADSKSYQRDMYIGQYHTQGAMIREGIRELTGVDIPTVINICIEKTYPYQIGIKIISQSALEAGHMKFKQALLDMKAFFKSNNWPSYEAEEVELPSWGK